MDQVGTLCLGPTLQRSTQHLAVLLALPCHLYCQGQSLLYPPSSLLIITSRFQMEAKAKILIGVMTMVKVNFLLFYKRGKMQEGINAEGDHDTKIRR